MRHKRRSDFRKGVKRAGIADMCLKWLVRAAADRGRSVKLIWVAFLAMACGSCNRPTDPHCLGGKGRIVESHPVEIHAALMTFIMGNAYLEDDANRGVYEVAEFGAQPQRLVSKIDADATRKGLDVFKSTVSLKGYEFTCARCGDHYVVVNAMTASEPTEYTDEDRIGRETRLRPFVRRTPSSRECEIPMR